VMITRADDGSGEATEMRGADDGEIASRARSSGPAIVLAEKDVNEIGASLVRDVGWAVRPAVRRSGAERRESGRIPTQALIASVVADPHAAFERSMKIGPLRDRGDRPRLLGGGHERREEQRDDRGDRREDGRDDRGDRPDDRRDHGAGPGLRRR